ncbi:hypothetical protein DM01DRAFT_1409422 [Hesseltinella vesiculosa]|uniref:C2H2-type domain-containing protein n=1 Tax=Hesseltinella vesiculosa TaxID=101127 RepID=A0A1X2GBY4_9FUNG|nr:hypothetical protein DM01DRAFT_1409422 [Hesseltinella vesiculosa]
MASPMSLIKEETPSSSPISLLLNKNAEDPTPVDDTQSSYTTFSVRPPEEPASSRGTLVRPYACPECEQSFSRPHNLKSHLATHSNIRPFQCTTCSQYFRRLHDLKRHEKLHTGEKPYVCDYCSRGFSRLDALNRHRRSEEATRAAARRFSEGDADTSSLPLIAKKPQPRRQFSTPDPSLPNTTPTITSPSSHASSHSPTSSSPNSITPPSSSSSVLTSFPDDHQKRRVPADADGEEKDTSVSKKIKGHQHVFRTSRPKIPQINIPPSASATAPSWRSFTISSASTSESLSIEKRAQRTPTTILSATELPTPNTAQSTTSPLPPMPRSAPAPPATFSSPAGSSPVHGRPDPPALPLPCSFPANLTITPLSSPHTQPPPLQPPLLYSQSTPTATSPSVLLPSIQADPNDPSAHAQLLHQFRDLESKVSTMQQKIHDLEVENRVLRSLVLDRPNAKAQAKDHQA